MALHHRKLRWQYDHNYLPPSLKGNDKVFHFQLCWHKIQIDNPYSHHTARVFSSTSHTWPRIRSHNDDQCFSICTGPELKLVMTDLRSLTSGQQHAVNWPLGLPSVTQTHYFNNQYTETAFVILFLPLVVNYSVRLSGPYGTGFTFVAFWYILDVRWYSREIILNDVN